MPTSWLSPVSGDWSEIANWSDGVPDALADAIIDLAGTYTVTISGAGNQTSTLTFDAADAIIDLQGTLEYQDTFTLTAGALFVTGGTLAGGTSLSIERDGVITGFGAITETADLGVPLVVTNLGLIEADGGTLEITVPSFTVDEAFVGPDLVRGTLRALEGSTISIGTAASPLDGDSVFTNLVGGTLTGGIYDILPNASITVVGSVDPIDTLAATIALTGPTAQFLVDGQELGETLTTIAAGGALSLFFGADFDSPNAVLIDGFLNLQLSEFAAAGGLTVSATGFIGGRGTITSPITNDGTIGAFGAADGQTLALLGDISGSGTLQVATDSILQLGGSVAGGVVEFGTNGTDGDGTLIVEQPENFNGAVAGFNAGDTIALNDVFATHVAIDPFDNQKLDFFVGNTVVYSLALQGDFSATDFAVAIDPEGGISLFVGVQEPVTVASGVFQMHGPDGFDYTTVFPEADDAVADQLNDLGGGRQEYVVDYGNGRQVVFEGTGLSLDGAFNPDGGTVDIIRVFDASLPGDPILLAEFFSEAATNHFMSIPFDPEILEGGKDFYDRLLFGNNLLIGTSGDDIFRDERGDNVFEGGEGFDTGVLGPDVTLLTFEPGAEPGTGSFTYQVNPEGEGQYTGIQNWSIFNFETTTSQAAEAAGNYNANNLPSPGGQNSSNDGEPHINTFDGVRYDLQTIGEHIYVRATDGSGFEVQTRSGAVPFTTNISVNIAVAVRIGDQRVTVDPSRADPLLVDGVAVVLPNVGDTFELDAGFIVRTPLGSLSIRADDGPEVEVFNFFWGRPALNIHVTLPEDMPPGSVEGLAGNADGDNTNDFMRPDGTLITNGTELTFDQLYGPGGFSNLWRVTNENSLFDYAPGESTETFTDLSAPQAVITLAQLPPEAVEEAIAVVLAAGITDPGLRANAIFDYALTGNIDFVTAAANAQAQGVTTSAFATVTDVPEIDGIGVSAVAATVDAAASGMTTVTFKVYRIGDTGSEVTIDFDVVDLGDGFFDDADFPGGLPSGQVVLGVGESSDTFTVDIPETAITQALERLAVGISADPDIPIIAGTAETRVIASVPVEGIDAVPGFQLVSNGATLTQDGNNWTLDLGEIVQGDLKDAVVLAAANFAMGQANALAGSYEVTDLSAIDISGADPFFSLGAGGLKGGLNVTLDTSNTGELTETITLNLVQSNASGFMEDLPDQVLTIVATVVPDDNTAPSVVPLSDSVGEDGPVFEQNLLEGASDPDLDDTLSVVNLVNSVTTAGGRLLMLGDDYILTDDTLSLTEAGFAKFNDLAEGEDDTAVFEFGVSDDDAVTDNMLTLTVLGAHDPGADILGTDAGEVLKGTSAGESMNARGGSDLVFGKSGDDTFIAEPGDGFDSYFGNGGSDTYDLSHTQADAHIDLLFKFATSDDIAFDLLFSVENAVGSSGNDTIWGTSGRNHLAGGDGNDWIAGHRGNDTLNGGDGEDTLIGGRGADHLTGGPDADTFLFEDRRDSGAGESRRDEIWDFEQGIDTIDVSPIDANSRQFGNQAFALLEDEGAAFSAPGQLRYVHDASGNTLVEGNIDNDAAPEFQLVLIGQFDLTPADFVL